MLTLTGSSSLANYQTALRSVTFANAANDDPTAGGTVLTRTVSFVTSDGALTSAAVTQTITVTAVNDAPVNTVPTTQTIFEDAVRAFNTANGNVISVADTDAGTAGVQETISVLHGTVTLAGTTGLTGINGTGTGTVTFTGTTANVNAALNGLTYIPSTAGPPRP